MGKKLSDKIKEMYEGNPVGVEEALELKQILKSVLRDNKKRPKVTA